MVNSQGWDFSAVWMSLWVIKFVAIVVEVRFHPQQLSVPELAEYVIIT